MSLLYTQYLDDMHHIRDTASPECMSRHGGRTEEGICKLIMVVLLRKLITPPTREIVALVKIVDGFIVIDSIQALSPRERAPPWNLLLRLQPVIGSLKDFFAKGLLEYRW